MFRRQEEHREELGKLSIELERQAAIYSGLGIQKDFIMRLLVPRPDQLPKELSIPVITLGTSVPLDRQMRFAGIEPGGWKNDFNILAQRDIAGGVTYREPHIIWMQDGSIKRYRDDPQHLWSHLNTYERPATVADGIALFLVHPNIRTVLNDHTIVFPGSTSDGERVPHLWYSSYHQVVALAEWFTGYYDEHWGCATTGGYK